MGLLSKALNPLHHAKMMFQDPRKIAKKLEDGDINSVLDPDHFVSQAIKNPNTKASTLDTTGSNPGATNRGMYMGPRGDTIHLGGGANRSYAPNPFMNSPTAQGMAGAAPPAPPMGGPPMGAPPMTGVAPPQQIPYSPPQGPMPVMKQPMPMPMSSPKMDPRMQQQMMVAQQMRGRQM